MAPPPPAVMETPQPGAGRQLIQGYHPGGFTVAGVRRRGSLLVFSGPDQGRTLDWEVGAPADITEASLAAVREQAASAGVDILVVGTGATFALLPPALRQAIRAWGPVVEAMATPAACRTYNILLTEERRVAAALIAMPAAAAAAES